LGNNKGHPHLGNTTSYDDDDDDDNDEDHSRHLVNHLEPVPSVWQDCYFDAKIIRPPEGFREWYMDDVTIPPPWGYCDETPPTVSQDSEELFSEPRYAVTIRNEGRRNSYTDVDRIGQLLEEISEITTRLDETMNSSFVGTQLDESVVVWDGDDSVHFPDGAEGNDSILKIAVENNDDNDDDDDDDDVVDDDDDDDDDGSTMSGSNTTSESWTESFGNASIMYFMTGGKWEDSDRIQAATFV